jgi:DNA-binding MarR family transcriptional regulator
VWLTGEQQRVWRSYLAMGALLQSSMNHQLEGDCGLSLADYDVLVALSESEPMRIFELGRALAWEQSRLSHQLHRMRDRGLVARQGSDEDRRGATVAITDSGRAALKAAAPGHAELVRGVVFDGMSAAELRALDRWTSMVLERLTSPTHRT